MTAATLATAPVSSAPPRSFKLDASVSGAGKLTAAKGLDCGDDCEARYRRGSIVEVEATPTSNETFERWGGDCYGASSSCSVLLDRPARVRAVFKPITREVRITVGGPGTITSDPPGLRCGTAAAVCSAEFGQGQTIRLIPAADPDARFHSFGGACAGIGGAGCDLTVGANEEVANRALATFSDATPASGQQPLTVEGGRVVSDPAGIDCEAACSAPFLAGTPVTLSSNSTWTAGCVGAVTRCTVVIDGPTSVVAHPRPLPLLQSVFGFGLTVGIQGRSGRVISLSGTDIRCNRAAGTSLACKHTFGKGKVVRLRALAARRSRFVGWTRACANYKRKPVCELRINSVKSTTAIFRP